ncbi:hypothetical protein H4R34_001470 [Dimargaris verticillata]|uniref:Trafficking protein particle complex subunit 11 domain-containing protein n=1 Tax=Dimargaris verticillata TaxID=2761393 RepID=A0A9W8EEY7_9FUNG|nr:hypothetical protein H4R34_001470 [Dimargaris verticillata]
MDAIPRPYLWHHYPVLGILELQSGPCAADAAAQCVRQALDRYPSNVLWDAHNAYESLTGFTVAAIKPGDPISAKLRFNPAESSSVTQSQAAQAAEAHSTLSPLNPQSPLYPDGLLAPAWCERQHTAYPAVLISFHDLQYYATNLSPDLADDRVAADIRYGQRLAKLRGLKHVPFVVADSSTPTERLNALRRATSLESKQALVVLQTHPVPEEQLSPIVKQLLEYAISYYRERAKAVKQRLAALPAPIMVASKGSSPTIHPDPKFKHSSHLPAQGWQVRYHYKLAVFSEFRQDLISALKYYHTTHSQLIEYLRQVAQVAYEGLPGLRMFAPRWSELVQLLHGVSWKVCKLYLHLHSTASSLEHLHGNINAFTALLSANHQGDASSYYWHWMTAQHQAFAELLELGASHGLTFALPLATPTHTDAPTTSLNPLGADFRFSASFGLDRSTSSTPASDPGSGLGKGLNPATVLQHPGFHYHAAALCSAQYRKKLIAELAQYFPSDAAPGARPSSALAHSAYVAQYLAPLRPVPTDQLYHATIALLTKAYELFKRRRSIRHTLYMASEIAETYFEAGHYATAAKFFDRIAKTYRREQWATVLTSTLRWSLHCAIETETWPAVVRLLVELLAPGLTVTPSEHSEYQQELMRVLATTAAPVPGLASAPDAHCVQQGTKLTPIEVDMTTTWSFVLCGVQFGTPMATLGRDTVEPVEVPFQVVLVVPAGGLSTPLALTSLRIQFNQPHHNLTLTNDCDQCPSSTVTSSADPAFSTRRVITHWTATAGQLGGAVPDATAAWNVEWLDCRDADTASPSTNLWLCNQSYKVVEGLLRPRHSGLVHVEKITARVATDLQWLDLVFPFEPLQADFPLPQVGVDPLPHKRGFVGGYAACPFGDGRSVPFKWLSCKAAVDSDASALDRVLKWESLSYVGASHGTRVRPAPSPVNVREQMVPSPILVGEQVPWKIIIDNQDHCAQHVDVVVTVETADARVHLAPTADTAVPAQGPTRSVRCPVDTVAAQSSVSVVCFLSHFSAAGSCRLRALVTYRPHPNDSSEAHLAQEIRLTHEIPVVPALQSLFRTAAVPLAATSRGAAREPSAGVAIPNNSTNDARELLTHHLCNVGPHALEVARVVLDPTSPDEEPKALWTSFLSKELDSATPNSYPLPDGKTLVTAFWLASNGALPSTTTKAVRITWRRALQPTDTSAPEVSFDAAGSMWQTTTAVVPPQLATSTAVRITTVGPSQIPCQHTFRLTYYVTNHTPWTQELDVSMQGTDGLVFSGYRKTTLVLSPGECYRLTYCCLAIRCGWLELPSLVVDLRRAGQTLHGSSAVSKTISASKVAGARSSFSDVPPRRASVSSLGHRSSLTLEERPLPSPGGSDAGGRPSPSSPLSTAPSRPGPRVAHVHNSPELSVHLERHGRTTVYAHPAQRPA